MSRLRPIACSGKLSDTSINISVQTLNSNQFSTLPVVVSPNFIELIIDPLQIYGALERVNMTAHASGSTAIMVARGQNGSAARTHNQSGVQEDWLIGPTDQDFIHGSLSSLDADDHTQYYNVTRHQTAGAHSAAAIRNDIFPVGMEFLWSGNAENFPSGFLIELGQAVSRTTYSALWALWGTMYGSGDGSTTFNLPNNAGAAFVGANSDPTAASWPTIIPVGGAPFTISGHEHEYSSVTSAAAIGASHTHEFDTGVDTFGIATGSAAAGSGSSHTHSLQGITTTAPSNFTDPHAHTLAGSSDPGNLTLFARPKFVIVKY